MKKIILFLALPFLAMAEPPVSGVISHTIQLTDRLPGYEHGFKVVIVKPEQGEKIYCIMADTVKTDLMTRVAVSNDKVYMLSRVYTNFKPMFQARTSN